MKSTPRKKIPEKTEQQSPDFVSLDAPDKDSKEAQAKRREQIELEAYFAWEKNGRNHGADQDHWLEAEKRLHGQGNPAYPTLDEREKLVKAATGEKTHVRKIPADDL